MCPDDRHPLVVDDAGTSARVFRCEACGRLFPVEQGVVRFLEESDLFYEGRYLNTIRYVPRSERPPASWPL